MKHFLKMSDLSTQEIIDILNLADQLKYQKKNNVAHNHLQGKTLGMIFQKASTRTRISFEVAMYDLGGYPLFLSANDLQISRGEPIQDTARVLSRYLDGIMIRTFAQKEVEDLAKYGSIPVINGLTDYEHPCQVMADLMTIREFKGSFKNLKVAYIGDGNNMANSLIVGCLKLGMAITVATPKGYEPAEDIVSWAKDFDEFKLVNSPVEAAKDADVLFTDVWASMGHEKQVEARQTAFKGFQINKELLKNAKSDAIVLHCLPAHRGEEITEEVFEDNAEVIFTEAENRLHAQKAILVTLLK